MGMSKPYSWAEFATNKEKLQSGQEDIMISDNPNGPMMKLSTNLKEQLHKPWANALILKNMGRSHTLNFMINKLTQKWNLLGQWQLTDLSDGYFVACFQMKEDLVYVLTGSPWVQKKEVRSNTSGQVQNEGSPYGPWLLVSYGKQGKRNYGNCGSDFGNYIGRGGYCDSASVLQQLRKDVLDFNTKYIGTSYTEYSMGQGELPVSITNRNSHFVEDVNFDTMASELEEDMVVVSE
ncbi:hypothetical protein Ddye_022024 [Dipteronia dyeriana]|uniref:DUF4283 domain-containing protein n=1 Tax=Dipteronia dyeriana TaxID=168575 RepID=A0AAD9WWV5_9ROSI|nr:hypothetical protein Ddye_022024 [Dipteronia dyeriana]